MADYKIVSLEEVDDWLGDYPGEMRGITYAIGSEQVALTYRRKTQEELYFVISGKLQFKLEDEIVELQRGQAVRVPAHVTRGVWNDEPADAELVIVSTRIDDPGSDGETVEGFWPE
jgi:mannose-6-phosphate isomerase-like protein (cupin superfamily)